MESTLVSAEEQLENRYKVMVCARNPKSGRHHVRLDRLYQDTLDSDMWPEDGIADTISSEVLLGENGKHELSQFVLGFLQRGGVADLKADEYWLTNKIQKLGVKADAKAVTASKSKPFFNVSLSAMLDWDDIETAYAIEGLIPSGEPTVWAGGAKDLKTTSAVQAALCMVTGRKYLNRFSVPRPLSVDFFSAESGLKVLARNSLRIAESMGFEIDDDIGEMLNFYPRVPNLDDDGDLAQLEQLFDRTEPDVAIFDPLYRMMPSDALSNIYTSGPLLDRLVSLCLARDITPIIVAHVKRSAARDGQPPELHDLAGAGIPEFFRAWVLHSRRKEYEDDGRHSLWISAGGSAGHNCRLAIDVAERRPDGSACWEVVARTPAELAAAQRELEASKNRQQKAESKEAARKRIKEALENKPEGETKTGIKDASGMNGGRFSAAFAELITSGEVVSCEITKNGKSYPGYRIVPPQEKTPESRKKSITQDNPGHTQDTPGTADA